MATTKQASFVAALTATDQLSEAEHKRHADAQRARAKRSLRDDRYEAWMTATAAFHRAMAATELACLARVHHHEDRDDRNAEELAEVRALIGMADRLMRLPFVNRDDRRAREVLVRQWRKCARTVDTAPLYDQASQQWFAMLQRADISQEGC